MEVQFMWEYLRGLGEAGRKLDWKCSEHNLEAKLGNPRIGHSFLFVMAAILVFAKHER